MPRMNHGGRSAVVVALVAGACAIEASGQCSADKLIYPEVQDSAAWFGWSVALSGDTAVAGALAHIEDGDATGGAFVFRRQNSSSWPFQQKLIAEDAAAFDSFGGSVAASGQVIVVGASQADTAGPNSGAAYVFRFDGAEWVQEQKLVPDDGAPFDGFGRPAVSGGVAVIGAAGADPDGANSGAAYVFRFDGAEWVQEQKLRPVPAAPGNRFGNALATDGQRVVVGAIGFDSFAGAVFIFEFDAVAGEWVQTHLLPGLDPESAFGADVGLDGDRIIVGVPGDSSDDAYQGGAAYVFAFDDDGGQWIEEAKLVAAQREELDSFGFSVALSGDTALVGKNPHEPGATAYPAVFVFDGAGWGQAGELITFFGWEDSIYGGGVAISGQAALVGSRPDWDSDELPGAAFVFNMTACRCIADFNADGFVNTLDFVVYLNAWASGHPGADIVHDGDINTLDFIAFLNAWAQGCP